MYSMSPYIVVAWVGVTLLLFLRFSRPVAIIVACIAGTLLLPEVQWSPVPPNTVLPLRFPPFDFTKINSISYGLLFGWLLLDRGSVGQLRLSRWDLPAVVLGIFPAFACLLADQSSKDAFSALRFSLLQWTVPYFIGRLYLSDAVGCRRVAIALVIAAAAYAPLCLLEVRIAPQLHHMVYGFQQHSFSQVLRFGGYRPMVFMQHGLAVALLMCLATLSQYWLWRSGAWTALGEKWSAILFLFLAGTAFMCKSFGAIGLGIAGVGTLIISRFAHIRWLWIGLILVMPLYVTTRATGILTAERINSFLGRQIDLSRKESFEFRVVNEDKFMAALRGQNLTGMGTDPNARPKDHNLLPIVIDGQWIIEYFSNGLVNLTALAFFFLAPAVRFLWNHPPEAWSTPAVAPAAIAAMICVLLAIDCIPNAMLNPFYMLVVAALNGWNDGISAMRRTMATVQVTS